MRARATADVVLLSATLLAAAGCGPGVGTGAAGSGGGRKTLTIWRCHSVPGRSAGLGELGMVFAANHSGVSVVNTCIPFDRLTGKLIRPTDMARPGAATRSV